MIRRFLLLSFLASFASSAFDHDTGANCLDRTDECESDTYFECPITCAKFLEPSAGASASGALDDEAFYEMQATNVNGEPVRFENYEGSVTVIASIPLIPGVAQYNYEMLEHLHQVYPWTLEIIVVPLKRDKGVTIVPVNDPKVTVLDVDHSVLQFLQSSLNAPIQNKDKVTFYLVGANGNSVEAFVSPTMPDFQKYLRYHFVHDLNDEF